MSRSNDPKFRKSHHPGDRSGFWLLLALVILVGWALVNVAVRVAPPETGPMGGLIYEARSRNYGVAEVAGLAVDGAVVELGHVPLDVTVTPTWTLSNIGAETITLGEPHATVVEGCCPGPLQLSNTKVDPGDAVELSFPLQMHPGMDGPHDFDIHVPIEGSEDYLTLRVVGEFG